MKKLEELRRRRGITGLLGCPSDTKDPDDWDWDNWDNWPQEDKEMFPIDEEIGFEEALHFNSHGKETEDPETWNDDFYDYDWLERNGTFRETDVPELEEVATELGYVYLYKGKYLAQADNGGVQIDHPAPEEVIQWFFDHYGKKLWESKMNDKESLNESVSFIDKWHDTMELIPDCENVWFIADGKIYIGLYEPEQKIFCMADGLGVPLANVRQWKYITEKEVAGYPKEKQIIAVDIPDFPCPVTGIFSDHLTDEETGDEFSGVVLDEEYTFCENGCDSIKWESVFAWYPLPEEPLKVIDVDNDIDFDNFEFEFEQEPSEELPIEEEPSADEVADDIGPEPLPEVGPEPLPEVGPEPLPEIEPEETSFEPEKSDEEIKAEIEGEEGSAIAASNPNSEETEEEDLVKTESKKSEGERLTESEYDSLDDKVKDWYVKEYPTDDMGEDIDPELSFYGIFDALDNYEDIYEVIGVGDSIIRERIFSELADRMGVDYDYVYDQWLRSADKAAERTVDWNRIDPDYIEELYKNGQTTAEERDTALENIRKAREGIYESVNKKNPHVREAKVY